MIRRRMSGFTGPVMNPRCGCETTGQMVGALKPHIANRALRYKIALGSYHFQLPSRLLKKVLAADRGP